MHRLFCVLGLFVLFAIGCAPANYSLGAPIASENVQQIVKGQTTAAQLQQLFGQPFTKTVVSATQEKWTYMHTTSDSEVNYLTGSGKTETRQRLLDVLVENGVVSNYAYTDGPISTVHH